MRTWIPVIGLVVGAMSCQRGAPSVPVPTPREPAPPSAAAVFDSMDTRVPVPLLPVMANHQKQNMREHLAAVQGIVGAIETRDFDAISRAASSIGYSEQMGQMCTHMGTGAVIHGAGSPLSPHRRQDLWCSPRARHARSPERS